MTLKKSLLVLILFTLLLSSCDFNADKKESLEPKLRETILLGDAGWDSLSIHNEIAKILIEDHFDVSVSFVSSPSIALRQALRQGELDVYMEVWVYDETFYEDVEKGFIHSAGANFRGLEGVYVPRYIIEGDPSRDIKTEAPDLKSVSDLKHYYSLFKRNENDSKGIFYSSVKGWAAQNVMEEKLLGYGLEEFFESTLKENIWGYDEALLKAYNEGKPWVGYYWEPTALMAELDLVLLEESPYDRERWDLNKTTHFLNADVEIAVSASFPDNHPDIFKFLENYYTGTELNNILLNEMRKNNWTPHETAKWFVDAFEDIWLNWLK